MNRSIEAKGSGISDGELSQPGITKAKTQEYFVVLYWSNRRRQKEGFISSGHHTCEDLPDVRDLLCLRFETFSDAQDYLLSCIDNHGYVWSDDEDEEE